MPGMGARLPKQFLPLDGRPVLMHTVQRVRRRAAAEPDRRRPAVKPYRILEQAVPPARFCRPAYRLHRRSEPIRVGFQRAQARRRGRADRRARRRTAAGKPRNHRARDGRRTDLRSGHSGRQTDRLRCRRIDRDGSRIVDRSLYRIVQTPQVFRADILRNAYARPFDERFTDDASVVEAAGQPVYLCEGSYENIKITTPVDMLTAEALLAQRQRMSATAGE